MSHDRFTCNVQVVQLAAYRFEIFGLFQETLDRHQPGPESRNRRKHADFRYAYAKTVPVHLQDFAGQLQVKSDIVVRQTQYQPRRIGQLEITFSAIDTANWVDAYGGGVVEIRNHAA